MTCIDFKEGERAVWVGCCERSWRGKDEMRMQEKEGRCWRSSWRRRGGGIQGTWSLALEERGHPWNLFSLLLFPQRLGKQGRRWLV